MMPDRKLERPIDKLYDRQRWRKRSRLHLSQFPMCKRCEDAGRLAVPAKLAHHVIHVDPYAPNEALFFCGELESLCHDCHEREHNRNSASLPAFDPTIDITGWPVDPAHPVYQHEGKRR